MFNKNLGCEVTSNILIRIDENLELASNYETCDLYNQDTCEQLGYTWQDNDCLFPINIDSGVCIELGYSWQNEECIQIIPDISDEFSCNLVPGDTNWNGDICYFKIEMNQTVCTDVINGEWQNEECYIACTSNEV